jgi:ubiquinone/menaquinone biosynthesis C-methylase UbiE
MDSYTKKTKLWLDKRFRSYDEDGIYVAHQPIYGFLKGHCEPDVILRYIITFQIMKAFSHLKFNSVLDLGGAEGYKAYIIRNLFNANVINSDLSEEACKRGKEIYDVDSVPADIHNLPFKNKEFDIVLCSETLEHVSNINKAIDELNRVAKKAIIITVPHEPIEDVEKNIENEMNHAHIHSFNLESLNFLTSKGYHIFSRKMIGPLTVDIAKRIEDLRERFFEDEDNVTLLIKKIVASLIQLDEFVSSEYHGILFIILKDIKCYTKEAILDISPATIMNFSVPYYFIHPMLQELSPKLLLPKETKQVSYYIDSFSQDKSKIEISGWGYIKGEGSENSKIYIILASDRNHYIFDTTLVKRPDVTAHFKTLNFDDSGFFAFIPEGSLVPGQYRIGIYIKKGETNYLQYTNKIITVGSS